MEQEVTVYGPDGNSFSLDIGELMAAGGELPNIISGQMNQLKDLGEKVESAISKAGAAKDAADDLKRPSWFKRTAAIEELQRASKDLASAVVAGTDAQKVSFEFQTKLAEITKRLFLLGAGNLALNRTVVREVEAKLRGASSAELTDLVKQELMNVLMQLKAQEDILVKQEQLAENIRFVRNENARQNEELRQQAEKDGEHDEELRRQAEKDEEHDEELRRQAEKDGEHDAELRRQAEKDEEHDELLAFLLKQGREQNEALTALKVEFSSSYSAISKKLIIAYAVGIVGVLIGAISLLLAT